MKKILALSLAKAFTASLTVLAAGIMSISSAQAEPKCIFGEDLTEIESITRFKIKSDVIKTFKVSRIPGDGDRTILVAVSIISDKKTKREFHMNTTFRHTDDGDNTIGWIEEVTGAENADGGAPNEANVVTVISDSFFDKCTLKE